MSRRDKIHQEIRSALELEGYVGFEDLHHQIIVFKSNKQLLWVK